jgi:GT2 family glycosyltransferase
MLPGTHAPNVGETTVIDPPIPGNAVVVPGEAIMVERRVGVVVITWERREEALAAVDRLRTLPERPPVVLVDNGSTDGTADAVRARFPGVDVVALGDNRGAVGRNVGVARLGTPYVAFCDDDTWWEPGSLTRAADVLDAFSRLAVVNARIVVEPGGADDPIVAELRDSPVPGPDWLPGPALGSFLAGASVVRRDAFLAAGGFSARLWLGGEEELLATDLLSAGWELCYLDDLAVHHRASTSRDTRLRRRVGLRNTLWFTWLRRPFAPALRRTLFLARTVPHDRTSALGAWDAVRGLPWLITQRRPRRATVEARLSGLDAAQRTSTARRYLG